MSNFAGMLKVRFTTAVCTHTHTPVLLSHACNGIVAWTDSSNFVIAAFEGFLNSKHFRVLCLQHILSWRISFIALTPTRPVLPGVWLTYLENCVSRDIWNLYLQPSNVWAPTHIPDGLKHDCKHTQMHTLSCRVIVTLKNTECLSGARPRPLLVLSINVNLHV